jgi:hypothetical protein
MRKRRQPETGPQSLPYHPCAGHQHGCHHRPQHAWRRRLRERRGPGLRTSFEPLLQPLRSSLQLACRLGGGSQATFVCSAAAGPISTAICVGSGCLPRTAARLHDIALSSARYAALLVGGCGELRNRWWLEDDFERSARSSRSAAVSADEVSVCTLLGLCNLLSGVRLLLRAVRSTRWK